MDLDIFYFAFFHSLETKAGSLNNPDLQIISLFLSFLFWGWNQGPELTKQVLYHQATPQPRTWSFKITVLEGFVRKEKGT